MEQGRSLAALTTLKLGGPAQYFVSASDRSELLDALAWARAQHVQVRVLGGGSNLLIVDEGVPGLVVQVATRGIALAIEGKHGLLTVQAGEVWDDVVSLAIDEGLAGIECLTGIPGSTGATPIQNVGAYGQEVADVIEEVEVLDRETGAVSWVPASECRFAYRDSRFKRSREVVLAVRFRLRRDGVPTLRYPELARVVGEGAKLAEVAAAVRALRASKGMLIDDTFVPSAGSFFVNPVLNSEQAAIVTPEMPQFPLDGGVKLSAAWLIEHAGFSRGTRRGGVGISDKHSLALVNYGGTAKELLALASEIQSGVLERFGVALQVEPIRWP
jgi:UDP-N-acetylmuramate dehydrogenase